MLLAPEGAACSLQAMRGVMFLIVWRKGHIIMALRPQRMSQLPPCRRGFEGTTPMLNEG